MTKRVSDRYIRGLLQTVQSPSLELDAIMQYWPKVERESNRKRHCLDRMIPKDDPIRVPVDLLAPLNRLSDETLHTRALAYLLDPSNDHGFERVALRAIAQTLRPKCRSKAVHILRLLAGKKTRISVTPEYRYKVEGFPDKSIARPDIWIEINAPGSAALVVVENKINARESNGQLRWYERKAREWCKREPGRVVSLLIFIALDQHEVKSSDSDQWAVLSYLELAAALRAVWKRKLHATGRSWLGLYIASITRGLLGLDISSSGGTELTSIRTYLGEGS